MASDSVDVVYFDPMFRRPEKSSSQFDALRSLAHSERLEGEAIRQACRVARRSVVVMDQPVVGPQAEGEGGELERL